jgi:hypothetical protein
VTEEDAAKSDYVRILVPLDREPGDAGPEDEWLWAEPLGNGRYRLESAPFFAYGLSRGDVVRAPGEGELPRVEQLDAKSGHRTLRVALDPDWDLDRPELQRFVAELTDMGCAVDALPPKIVALDVPPEVDVATIVEKLQIPFRDGVLLWEWADPRPS